MKKFFVLSCLLFLASIFSVCGEIIKNPRKKIVLERYDTVVFNQPFTMAYVAKKQAEILAKDSILEIGAPIKIVVDSPGGSVTAGRTFIDFLNSLDRPIQTITLFAASMGYHLVQSLGERYITESGELMSHRVSISGHSGQINGEAESRMSRIKKIADELDRVVAKRINMSLRKYQSKIVNELWVNSKEAVLFNHADAVVDVQCGISLKGTYSESFQTMFGNYELEFSECPLIRYPLGISKGNNFTPKETILEIYNKMKNTAIFTL